MFFFLQAVVWSTLFKYHLELGQYSAAYEAMVNNPDPSRLVPNDVCAVSVLYLYCMLAVVCTVSELLRYICTAVVYTVSELYDVSVLYACCYLYCICTVTKALHVRSRRQLISYSQKWLTTSYFKAPPLYDGQKEKLLINLFIYLCTRSLLPRRKDCLQRFVVVLTEQKALKELCQFPYAGLEDEVCVRQLP